MITEEQLAREAHEIQERQEHLALLRQGTLVWNDWRRKHQDTEPDLRGITDLGGANLRGADLHGALLYGTYLAGADLTDACFDSAGLDEANLGKANLSGAKFRSAQMLGTSLFRANLSGADLRGADLSNANLVGANLTNADLSYCRIYGTSAWSLILEGTKQQDLIVTRFDERDITIDNIEVAQFIYLLLNNQKIRDVIDTLTSKVVLILGRFTNERKAILDSLKSELLSRNYLPILFDTQKPSSLSTDETITLLARMARFVIADVSDAKSILQELRAIVPDLPSVPVQAVIVSTQEEPGMFDFYRGRPSFLPVYRYDTPAQLLGSLTDNVIWPAETKVLELRALAVPSTAMHKS